jgi:hypothetical protein
MNITNAFFKVSKDISSVVLQRSDADLGLFARTYISEANNNEKPQSLVEYLKRCDKVRVFKDKDHNWIAGYAINTNRPFRYLEDYDFYETIAILNHNNIESVLDLVEITSIWIKEDMRIVKLEDKQDPDERKDKLKKILASDKNFSNLFFAYSVYDAWQTNKKFVIGGSIEYGVWKRLKLVLKHQLYLGRVSHNKKENNNGYLGLVLFTKGRFYIIFSFFRAFFKQIIFKKFNKKTLLYPTFKY